MNRIWIVLTLFVLISCQKDTEEPIITDQTLHYDGANQNAPLLAHGISYPAIKFPANYLTDNNHAGKKIKQIYFHLTQIPGHLKLLIFDWNTTDDNIPGNLLFEKDIDNPKKNSWNTISMEANLTLPQNGIWIAFEIDTGDEDLRVIGCDAGPRKDNGDIYGLFGDNNPGWTDFYNFSQEQVDINWNIRLTVE